MDVLDILFRLERKFDVYIPRDDFIAAFPKASEGNLRAGQLIPLILAKLPEQEVDQSAVGDADDSLEWVRDASLRWLQEQLGVGPATHDAVLGDVVTKGELRALKRRWQAAGIKLPLSMPWRRKPRTVAELADCLASDNARYFARIENRRLRRNDIWLLITQVLSDALGVDQARIHPESDLVKDLDMN